MGEAALNEARVETHVAEGADQTDDVVTRAALTEERGVAEERGFARVRRDETGDAFLSGVEEGVARRRRGEAVRSNHLIKFKMESRSSGLHSCNY